MTPAGPFTRPPAAPRKLSHRHQAMIDFLAAYPEASVREVASRFDISPVRVRQLLQSDLFQFKLAERREEVFERTLSLREKTEAAAHLALDKLTESLEIADSPEFQLAAADKLLGKLGYGGKGPAITVNSSDGSPVQVNVGSETLQAARQRIANSLESQ